MQVTKGPVFDDASVRLFEIWQVEGSFHDDELESDLLSENGLDLPMLKQEWLFPGSTSFDLLQYDDKEMQDTQQLWESSVSPSKKRSRTCCNFLYYPPGLISLDKVRKIVPYGKGVFDDEMQESPWKRCKLDDDIPSLEDLMLPSFSLNKDDPVAVALEQQLQDLLDKFKTSYASLMDTKKQLL
jgi:hypothetical protein